MVNLEFITNSDVCDNLRDLYNELNKLDIGPGSGDCRIHLYALKELVNKAFERPQYIKKR